MRDLILWPEDFVISGALTNRTDRSWRLATFRLKLYDKERKLLVYDDRFDGQFHVKNISPDQTKPITGIRDERPARFLLKPDGEVASIDAEFIPERSYWDSRMTFALVEPFQNSDLFFLDDWLAVSFEVTRRELRFVLRNRTGGPLSLLWEGAAYLDLLKQSHRVIHHGVPLAEKDRPQIPTQVGPHSTVEEWVYPVDCVAGSRVFNDWRLNPLFPLSPQEEAFRGKSLSLMLPVEAGEQRRNYRFEIQIVDIVVL